MDLLMQALEASAVDKPLHDVLGLSRRQFLKLGALVAGSGLAGFTLTGCGPEGEQAFAEILEQIRNRPVRRDIATLAPNDPIIQSYEVAITAMRGLPESDPRNWTRQAQIHLNSCRHRSWLFFPWHRAYLLFFEQICRELSGNASFALPYWNWTANPQIPAIFWDQSSPLFHSDRIAGQNSTADPGSVGPDVIDGDNGLLRQKNFLVFAGGAAPLNSPPPFGPGPSGTVEGTPHNYVHGWIGATMGTFMSALDPIFWTHHNRVEQLWVDWNLTRGNPNTNHSNWTDTRFTEFCDRNGNPVEVSVGETLLYPLLSYRFDTQTAP